MVNRIKNLNEDIQEYINIGIKIGLFNETNLERIISRLERVEFSIDNSIPGDAQTVPIRDNNNPRISYGIDIKINKRKTLSSDKYYFKDEVVFHELTHAINGLYENWFDNLSLYFDYNEIFMKNFNVRKEILEEYDKNPEFRQRKYTWLVLDEFVSQYVAQMFVEAKYKTRIYFDEKKNIYQSSPIITHTTELADYHEFSDIVLRFIEILYDGPNIEQFIKDSLDNTIITKIYETFKNKNDGFNKLYNLFRAMGNIGFAVASKNFTKNQQDTDLDMTARNPRNFYRNYNECFEIMNGITSKKTEMPLWYKGNKK